MPRPRLDRQTDLEIPRIIRRAGQRRDFSPRKTRREPLRTDVGKTRHRHRVAQMRRAKRRLTLKIFERRLHCVNLEEKQFSFSWSTPKGTFLLVLSLAIVLGVQPVLAASGMFPKMPAATNVYVVDCQKDSENARMTAWALQGLVNQSFAEAYIIEKEKPRHLEQLKYSGKPFELLEPLTGNNPGLRTLFKKYHDRVRKMIVYDSKKD